MPDIARNVYKIKQQIAGICQACHRNPEEITLIAVTKTHPAEFINEALRSGVSHFGENKVQEALRKLPFVSEAYEGFHYIGHLQSNKIRHLLTLKPALIQSIDSIYIAEKLNLAAGNQNLTQNILVQINTTREESKTGVTRENALVSIQKISKLKNLRIKGLMTIGLFDRNPEITRPFFRELNSIFDEVASLDLPNVEMKHLSMGMTDDFPIALEEGSNMVRIGSGIFGARNYNIQGE
ncbi:MAG: YggS family pyridoxal phosphate-dependent enzyme [Candidatus Cloacimonetes bacterium]|nr:YggS family pyridoxal phosphate-dependent enzyme [Candidatus Cloacimonadota bacterium]